MDRVIIFDTTLRDGEQAAGASLNAQEKLEIAKQLDRLGVDVIEAGFPISSPGDFEAVQLISMEVRRPIICAWLWIELGRQLRRQLILESMFSSPPRISTFSTSLIKAERKFWSWLRKWWLELRVMLTMLSSHLWMLVALSLLTSIIS